MATVRELMDLARAKIDDDRAQAGTLNAVYKFVLEGDDGGTFLVNMMDDPGITETDGDAQCVIKMNAADFIELVESRADARQYLFMGKLRIDGNVGMAIKLRKFTDMFRDDE